MYWVNFVHIYQPPTNPDSIVEKVAEECYRPLFREVKQNKDIRFNLNISACLTQRLLELGYSDVIDNIKDAIKNEQIELVGSAAYHPILPLISKFEAKRQIHLQREINGKHIGNDSGGFFPPEMAMDFDTMSWLEREERLKYIVIDEISFDGKYNKYNSSVFYYGNMAVFFRSRDITHRFMSRDYPIGQIAFDMKYYRDDDRFFITGTDGEFYGHHNKDGIERLVNIVDLPIMKGRIKLFGEIVRKYPRSSINSIVAGAWDSLKDDVKRGIAFSSWRYPEHEIHNLQWDVINSLLSYRAVANDGQADLLDRVLHSCQFWWASCRPWWSVDMIMRGVSIMKEIANYFDDSVILEKINKLESTVYKWENDGIALKRQEEYKELANIGKMVFGG